MTDASLYLTFSHLEYCGFLQGFPEGKPQMPGHGQENFPTQTVGRFRLVLSLTYLSSGVSPKIAIDSAPELKPNSAQRKEAHT